MKKTFLIALAGMMLFAFTQCGGGNGGTTVSKGSQEFKDNMELYKKIEKTIKDTKTCEELSEAVLGVLFMGLANDKEYADDEKMTEEEKAELEKYGEKFEELFQKQAEKLGCEEDDLKLF